jgi:hypothetical protein
MGKHSANGCSSCYSSGKQASATGRALQCDTSPMSFSDRYVRVEFLSEKLGELAGSSLRRCLSIAAPGLASWGSTRGGSEAGDRVGRDSELSLVGAGFARPWLTEHVDDWKDGNLPDEERISPPLSRYFASVNILAIFFFGRIRVNVGCNLDRSARPLLPMGIVCFPRSHNQWDGISSNRICS